MARAKTPQKHWGLYMSLGAELQKHVSKAGYAPFHLHRDLTLMLVRVATGPSILTEPQAHADDVLAFHRAYARDPDAVLGCLTFIRKTIKHWQSYPAGFMRLYLRQNPLRRSTSRNGMPVRVSSMSDQEFADYLTPIAGFPITADTVKKARQHVVKEDRVYGIFEHPVVQRFCRDGVVTPQLKRLLRQTKGCKKAVRVAAVAAA